MTTVETSPTIAGFTRYAMIVCAVVAPLVLALTLLFAPHEATAEGEAYIRSFVANLDGYALWSWLGVLSIAAFIPGIFAVSKVARSGRPVLGLVGMILAFILALPIGIDTDGVIYAATKIGLDVPTTNRLVTEIDEGLPTSALGFSFFLSLLGFVLLGIAALRSAAPKWAAIAMIVAPFLIPVAWIAQLGNLAAGAAWLVFAAASGGIALALPPAQRT
ncbi:hypothetical protein ETD86_51370 [Nonomuraea turkmeniaca]|uniref:DUF4386 family protein n=1 Tax=Nonomuraea turkmeniaca TaxID=103838 RepID=A0A5S4EVJ4_9ACTN|nr:hypothetical protein [Nonomuraea turkmeniaca]TMR07611.1 hypothetical protein ETD86_51370 [Nonomuraea turkmeniaca]